MTTLLLLLALTIVARPQLAATAIDRAWQGVREGLNSPMERHLRSAAFCLAGLAFVAAHIAHDAQTPYSEISADMQDEVSWAVAEGAQQPAE